MHSLGSSFQLKKKLIKADLIIVMFKPDSQQDQYIREKKKKGGIGSKVLKSVITALTGVAAGAVADKVTAKVTGKESKSKKSLTEKAVSRTTRSATATLTRSILGNLMK